MPLFKFICVQYQFHGQTLPIMKIQIQFREYVSTGTEPKYIYKRHNYNFLVFCLEPLALFGVILILQRKNFIQGDIVIEVGSSRGYIGGSRSNVGIKSGQSVLCRS